MATRGIAVPINTVRLRPGIDVEMTPTLNSMGWSQAQAIRWREGLPEKLGGWSHINGIVPFTGIGRGLHAWADLNGVPYIAVGTEQRLQTLSSGTLIDITPIAATSNITMPFTTTALSTTITITDPTRNPNVGDWINIITLSYVNGISLQGFFQVTSIVSANQYTITAPSAATSGGTGGVTLNFSVTSGSPTVTFTLGAATFQQGSFITIGVPTPIAGLTLSGSFPVSVSGTTNTFTAGATATSTANASENGGAVRVQYLAPTGLVSNTPASGYGIGIYGLGLYGGNQPSPTALNPLRQWALDHWGAFLIGNYTGSTLYFWNPASSGPAIPTAGQTPSAINWSFVAMPQQMAVTLGADPGNGILDPNLVRWSDVADFTTWNASSANQAGSFRIPTGSRIVGGLQGPFFGCIWTDVDFWIMQYLQPPLVWGFNKIANGVGLLAPRGATVLNGVVYWVSQDNFYKFDGSGVTILRCPVWDKFFKNLNLQQKEKVTCAPNSVFSEIAWYFPSSTGTGEVDSYIKVNVLEGSWDYGTLARTAWVDVNVLGTPIGADLNGNLQQHDLEGVYDADGQPLTSFIQSGFMSLSDGTFQVFMERLIPDLILAGGTQRVTITVLVQNYPSDPIYSVSFPVTPSIPYLITRLRGRVAAVKIASTDLGVFWRLGALRYLAQPAGRR
jgi:hypothetical protein